MSISLNSLTKYKTRILDGVIYNLEHNKFPKNALYSLAALLVFYRGKRQDQDIKLQDNPELLELMSSNWNKVNEGIITTDELVVNVLSEKSHWEFDFNSYPEVIKFVQDSVKVILEKGVVNEFFHKELNFRK